MITTSESDCYLLLNFDISRRNEEKTNTIQPPLLVFFSPSQITQVQLQEISYVQAHKQVTSNAQAPLQETSIAQAHKQKTFNQTELQRNLFEFEHLIYNQWCSQYKSNTYS